MSYPVDLDDVILSGFLCLGRSLYLIIFFLILIALFPKLLAHV
jgi:hypothetical protein